MSDGEKEDRIMTQGELAVYFRVTTRTIKRWTSSGKIPSIKGDRMVRYNLAQVLEKLGRS